MQKSIFLLLSATLPVVLGLGFASSALAQVSDSSDSCAPMTLASGASACGSAPNMSISPTEAELRQQHADIVRNQDKPIEHDPIGQALVELPITVITGGANAAGVGKSFLGGAAKEVFTVQAPANGLEWLGEKAVGHE
jgi:hypothetical protein